MGGNIEAVNRVNEADGGEASRTTETSTVTNVKARASEAWRDRKGRNLNSNRRNRAKGEASRSITRATRS